MSEAERKKRQDYKRNRRKWIVVQSIAILLVALIAAGSFLIFNEMNRTYYVHYTEKGGVDYKVHYRENDFFEEEWIGRDQAYVTSLVDNMQAEFKYDLVMDTDKVSFEYRYSISAQVRIVDKHSGAPFYAPSYELLPEQTATAKSNRLRIREQLYVDFVTYNREAKSFVDAYGLDNADCTLLVTLYVNVLGACEEFEEDSENSYFVTLNVPLNDETFSMFHTSSIDEGESKVLTCSDAEYKDLFLTSGIISTAVTILLASLLIAYVYLTRNDDINYTIKVKRIVSAYRSFIQQMDGDFNTDGYQIVCIKTFVEMLGIRDTIQSPVLMSENQDQTCTKFLIPTPTQILYVFEIKVDNYDELYGLTGEDHSAQDVKEEEILLNEASTIEAAPEEVATPEEVAVPEEGAVPDTNPPEPTLEPVDNAKVPRRKKLIVVLRRSPALRNRGCGNGCQANCCPRKPSLRDWFRPR